MRRALIGIIGSVVVLAAAAAPTTAASAASRVNLRTSHAVCDTAARGFAHCSAFVSYLGAQPFTTTGPAGLSPVQIKHVYGYSTSATAGAGTTIAIVDAYDDQAAVADLGVFSNTFGLPACTTANGCFKKVNQTGGTTYPRHNPSWSIEVSLDVQWAHAIAPGAKILLVEATTNSNADLFAAEDYAKTHAQYVSNSWGGGEYATEKNDDGHFFQAGVSIFAASGDEFAVAEYPSSSPNVVSVGGTTLTLDGQGNLASETGWSQGGGGCSQYERGNVQQLAFLAFGSICPQTRMTPDVALDADPNSGVSVYDSIRTNHHVGWWIAGGTSAATPMFAARAAVSGTVVNAATVYGNTLTFRDITSGFNGNTLVPGSNPARFVGSFCVAGYDTCSGRGSWIGATP